MRLGVRQSLDQKVELGFWPPLVYPFFVLSWLTIILDDYSRVVVGYLLSTTTQVLLSRLPGYAPSAAKAKAVLTLPELAREIENHLINEYLVTPHSATREPPQSHRCIRAFTSRRSPASAAQWEGQSHEVGQVSLRFDHDRWQGL